MCCILSAADTHIHTHPPTHTHTHTHTHTNMYVLVAPSTLTHPQEPELSSSHSGVTSHQPSRPGSLGIFDSTGRPSTTDHHPALQGLTTSMLPPSRQPSHMLPGAATSMSLEGVLQHSLVRDQSSLLQLIEVWTRNMHPHRALWRLCTCGQATCLQL